MSRRHPPKGVSIDRLSGVGAPTGVCLLPWGSAVWPQCWLFAVCAGVVRSAVWPQCWLFAVCAVGHIGYSAAVWGGSTLWG